jgi:Stress responsive A/B Barrel Domain
MQIVINESQHHNGNSPLPSIKNLSIGMLQQPTISNTHLAPDRESDCYWATAPSSVAIIIEFQIRGQRWEMLVHIALFRWKDSATKDQIDTAIDQIRGLRNKVPDLIDIRCGLNTHRESKGLTHAIVVLARTQKALDEYRKHPQHDVAAKVIEEMEADGLGCDFEDNT